MNVSEFVETIRKSGLLEPHRLESLQAELADQSESDAQPIAERLVADGTLTEFQANLLLKARHKGFIICSKYRVLDLLGAGGMGRVFLCEHIRMRRLVALKTLPESQANVPGAVERFDREARAVAALQHPNIVQAYDVDEENERHFLVMEYVDGASFAEILKRRGPLDPIRTCHYIAQAALGLQHAYEKAGIVHRDIKPGNLLLSRDGVVKILDMGLARFFMDDNDQITRRHDGNSVLGTADYLSPEQALDSSAVDIRSDIYSLGCTFYHLLTGKAPFAEGSVTEKLLWHQVREPIPVTALRKEVHPAIEAVVRKMMAKQPASRYQTPAEVALALAPWTQIPIPPPGEDELPPSRWHGRRSGDSVSGVSRPSQTSVTWLSGSYSGLTPHPSTNIRLPGDLSSTYQSLAGVTATAGPARRWPMKKVITGVGLGMLLIGAIGFALVQTFKTSQPVETKPVGKLTHFVSVVKPGMHRKITDAIKIAQTGDIIQVIDEVWEEELRLTVSLVLAKELTIRGEQLNGQPVYWQPPPGHAPNRSLISTSELTNLRFTGFIFDGKNEVKTLINLTGQSSGTGFEQCQFLNYAETGLRLNQCHGSGESPMMLSRCSFSSKSYNAVAVRLISEDGYPNRHIRVKDTLLRGPGLAAIELTGETRTTEFIACRFAQFRYGVLYPRTDREPPPASLDLVNCTFFGVDTILDIDTAPPIENVGKWQIRHNLFVGANSFLKLGRGKESSFLLPDLTNAADKADRPGQQALGVVEVEPAGLNTTSNDPTRFLRYPSNSPLATFAKGKPVGAPPQ
jgi:serine/threonine protein kinase